MANQDFADVTCKVCGEAYKLYFERPSGREDAIARVSQTLVEHHETGDGMNVHPLKPFNVPAWSGKAQYSGAALLGGAPSWA
ncbi:hypothetical protein [Silvibacterium acidisoli]|uniref:hypothetical protein n=1 Tax=Acidobacteriaceae bacterium ZG23-2 TaxID=2883246 RepID=UPI00406C8E68